MMTTRARASASKDGLQDIVDAGMQKKYIRGLKGEYTFEEYMAIFTDVVDVFGRFGAGSCLLAGIEAAENTINGSEELAKIGVAPAPAVLTPFVVKQMGIPFSFDLEELIDTHVRFNNIVAASLLRRIQLGLGRG
ncbi:hypothetical protein [Bradyrhizobium sp. CSS354]|uniref:hypothetical protein n=1 Tax=Bradyrhizobium sp. CSS354 TaxID=2699172 RepID=UPI0023AF2DD6|nr:hypothetical protein [Bradyrhizobium sp. CSS354]MDE5465382.1 hypothetical protein [Bradyrhizobium sp. CSS354]